MVIMVSIVEKERYSYFRYSFGNSLKSITRKEPGCRQNTQPQEIRDLINLIEARMVETSDSRKCICAHRLSDLRLLVRQA